MVVPMLEGPEGQAWLPLVPHWLSSVSGQSPVQGGLGRQCAPREGRKVQGQGPRVVPGPQVVPGPGPGREAPRSRGPGVLSPLRCGAELSLSSPGERGSWVGGCPPEGAPSSQTQLHRGGNQR